MNTHVLVVEDDPLQLEMMQQLLMRQLSIKAVPARSGREALKVLASRDDLGLVILDIGLPDCEDLSLLSQIRRTYPSMPVIMLTGMNNVDLAVEAMKKGAYDFLNKPVNAERLKIAITHALRTRRLEMEVDRLSRKQSEERDPFEDVIGHDQGLRYAVELTRKAAITDVAVLLTGETGTGKDVMAQALHKASPRSAQPFVAVNCGAMPSQLVESILFGHEKGAFTGAVTPSQGRFREADGGTIFLDEVGDLPLEAQVKLLRVLQDQEIRPLGATRPRKINVRILSATNRPLEEDMKNGTFREDLYFRLNVLNVELPPLRERREDIPLLVAHMCETWSMRHKQPLKLPDQEAMRWLEAQTWPGNVRELENKIQRALLLSEDERLKMKDFIIAPPARTATSFTQDKGKDPFTPRTLAEIEQHAIIATIAYCEGNMTRAAEMLGIAKSTLYRKT